MNIYSYEEAFGAWDQTSRQMRDAIDQWFKLYYGVTGQDNDGCQRIAYTVVSKLVRTVFAEYSAVGQGQLTQKVLSGLETCREQAVALALVGGECYLKPWITGDGFGFTVIPRNRVLIFGRDARGEPTDVGTMERSVVGDAFYTLLERRHVDAQGYLTIENRLYRSFREDSLGSPVLLRSHPEYAQLADCYTFEQPVGSVGLVRLKTPMLNCVDGSPDGVSVYAAAVGLIHAIDKNEQQLSGEFDRGQSRVFVSADLLDGGQLKDNVFVGLDAPAGVPGQKAGVFAQRGVADRHQAGSAVRCQSGSAHRDGDLCQSDGACADGDGFSEYVAAGGGKNRGAVRGAGRTVRHGR